MKVTFKLSGRQVEKAKSVVADFNAEVDEIRDQHFNRNQKFELDGFLRELTYVGQRCPLGVDGGLDLIDKLFGSRRAATEAVIHYETSDKRLRWDETVYDYMVQRADVHTVIQWCGQTHRDPGDILGDRLPKDVQRCLNVNRTRAAASLTPEEMKIWSAVMAVRNKL